MPAAHRYRLGTPCRPRGDDLACYQTPASGQDRDRALSKAPHRAGPWLRLGERISARRARIGVHFGDRRQSTGGARQFSREVGGKWRGAVQCSVAGAHRSSERETHRCQWRRALSMSPIDRTDRGPASSWRQATGPDPSNSGPSRARAAGRPDPMAVDATPARDLTRHLIQGARQIHTSGTMAAGNEPSP